LSALYRKLSLSCGALVLNPLLASILLHREPEPDDDES
jgi:hypothetical protein